jgi:hypothetical protein
MDFPSGNEAIGSELAGDRQNAAYQTLGPTPTPFPFIDGKSAGE